MPRTGPPLICRTCGHFEGFHTWSHDGEKCGALNCDCRQFVAPPDKKPEPPVACMVRTLTSPPGQPWVELLVTVRGERQVIILSVEEARALFVSLGAALETEWALPGASS